jgi:hypothetical protein
MTCRSDPTRPRRCHPGQTVIIRGIPTCHYGICHAMMDATSRLTGADIFYIANSRGAPMRSYLGLRGFIPAEMIRTGRY